jgi:hypothetical protein
MSAEIDYNTVIIEVMHGYDGESQAGLTKDAIWKALTLGGFKFPKKPAKTTFSVKLSKLVEQNVLETKNGLFKITKNYLKKWVSKMEKTKTPEPPKVVSKSKASMKKGASKKIQTKKNARKTAKRSAAKQSAAKKKAETKKRQASKRRSQAKKATKKAKASNKKAKGESKKKGKKEQASKKVEAVKAQNTRAQRMANKSVRVKAEPSQDLKLKEGVQSKSKNASLSQP